MTPDDDLAACRATLANGSRTFLAASLLLPSRVRDPACALYAFCRLADDAIDEAPAGATTAAVAALAARLDAIYAGRPDDHAADRALADVVRRFGLARTLLDALVDGFAWDAAGRPIDTIDDLHDYAARVAGSVGAMMATLMGTRDADALARACDLGVAMQLSNIARDVGEDARRGRLYLPRAWLRDAGLDPDAWLARPSHDAALASVVARLLDEADRLYRRVGTGVARLPWTCRPGINAARRLYAEIGREVARRDHDAIAGRAVVPPWRKAFVLATAVAAVPLLAAVRRPAEPPLHATAFLVDAAVDRAPPSPSGVVGRAIWTIELFERLARRDAGLASSSLVGEVAR